MWRGASESSWLYCRTTVERAPVCKDKQLAVQDPCVRISTVDLCEDKQGNQSHLSRHVLPFFFHTITLTFNFFHTITPTSNFFYTIPPLSLNIQFLNVIFPFLLTTWSVSRLRYESSTLILYKELSSSIFPL